MSDRENARYEFGVTAVRFSALNDDFTQVEVDNTVGGYGPFDFTGYTASAIPLTIKIDGTEYERDVDISAAVSQSAVTVDEVVTALTTLFAADPAVPMTASKDSNNRIKLAATGAPNLVQVYDDFAEVIKIGQGLGTKVIYCDTISSVDSSARRKDSETFTKTDANGYDTEVVGDGYYKGETGSIVDTASDFNVEALLEGTPLNDNGGLSSPVSNTKRPFFKMEVYYKKFKRGINHEDEQVGYRQEIYAKAKGLRGDKSRSREFSDGNYSFMADTYVDSNNVEQPAWNKNELTNQEFAALKIDQV